LPPPGIKERVEAAREHLQMSVNWKGEGLGIAEMKRHYTNYFKGIHSFKEYKQRLVTIDDAEGLFKTLDEVAEVYSKYQFI
jgi:tRNA-dihydrouridine synthase